VALSPESRRQLKARAAALRRHHPTDPAAGAEEFRDLRADTLERHVREVVDGLPPLTAEQKTRLTLLLHGGDPDGAP
jgi:hypothetical protein